MLKPHSSIGSGCVSGVSRVVLYKFGQIDIVRTLVQDIYFKVDAYSTSITTHSDALLHTICFLSTKYFMPVSEGVPYIFDNKNKGKNSPCPCC